jgi:hypothetical protein
MKSGVLAAYATNIVVINTFPVFTFDIFAFYAVMNPV